MEHLFSAWDKVSGKLSRADHVLLLTDYDGTLTPIAERPEEAELSQATRFLLQGLSRQRRYTIGIISGRALSDLKARIGLKDVMYAGNHGLEIEGPALSFVHPVAQELKGVLFVLYSMLRRGLGAVAGALVENKGLTLSVHYRLVDPASVPQVRNVFERIVRLPLQVGQIRATEGKKVYEVRPAVDWHKGKAISMILGSHSRARPKARPVVVFLGDDLTDEDGFKVMGEVGGVSVLVGEEPRPTAAQFWLRSPGEVQEFLSRLVDAERRRP